MLFWVCLKNQKSLRPKKFDPNGKAPMQNWSRFKGIEIIVSPHVSFTFGNHNHFNRGRTRCAIPVSFERIQTKRIATKSINRLKFSPKNFFPHGNFECATMKVVRYWISKTHSWCYNKLRTLHNTSISAQSAANLAFDWKIHRITTVLPIAMLNGNWQSSVMLKFYVPTTFGWRRILFLAHSGVATPHTMTLPV